MPILAIVNNIHPWFAVLYAFTVFSFLFTLNNVYTGFSRYGEMKSNYMIPYNYERKQR